MGCLHSREFVPNPNIEGQGESSLITFRALGLSDSAINSFYYYFSEIDDDDNGTISLDEFYDYFGLIRSPFSDMVFQILDKDSNGTVNFSEFVVNLWEYCSLSPRSLANFAFRIFDKNNNTELSLSEVFGIVQCIYGPQFDQNEEIRKVIDDIVHTRGSQPILEEDFTSLAQDHPILLLPAFTIQQILRKRVCGLAWWKEISQYREENNMQEQSILEILSTLEPKV